MSTDFTTIAQSASPTELTAEQRKRSALRAWNLSGLLVLSVLACLFFGGSGLVLYLHSINRPAPPNPPPVVNPDGGNDAHPTIDASATKALVELDRLSFSMELAQAEQAFAHLEIASSRWQQLHRETLNDDLGRHIAGSRTLLARFIALGGMDEPEQFSSNPHDELKNLAVAVEATNDERILQDLPHAAADIKDRAIAWYAHHQASVQMLEEMRDAATDLPITAAGGITTIEEIRELTRLGIHAALGMAIYTGKLDLEELARLN